MLPVHNRLETTKKFIDCLLAQTYQKFHLVLIDDGCTDGTPDYVDDVVTNSTILRGNGSLWWGGSLQKAFKYLVRKNIRKHDIVWICNDDTTFDEAYFQKVVNDPKLSENSLVISPGHCSETDFIEFGFTIDWDNLVFEKIKHRGEIPDALTTRGLYMYFTAFKRIGGFPHHLVPHYLSDLEYTIRAKRKGFKLKISDDTVIEVDRSLTGIHQHEAKTYREFFYKNLISKKSAFNSFFWGNFVILSAPWGTKVKSLIKVYKRFYWRLAEFRASVLRK